MKQTGYMSKVLLCICLVPLLIACGVGAASEPTAVPTVAATATVPPPTDTAVPTAVPTATNTPEPTEEPTPVPGEPIKSKIMQFGIVNHLYYTDRERVLALTNIAGFDWVRQQIVWK
ncbi:MAG: hypothetical protein EBS29_12645, partial [Chloroflexia bacterium]|nr:hypothetical protein [Chloroflexia bacterium]